jgi:hypothetical protein
MKYGKKNFMVKGTLFKYPGAGGWHFIEIDKKTSAFIKEAKATKVGWGFVKVRATIGATSWNTTFFPTKQGPFLLSVKAAVRKKEDVFEGDRVTVQCELL